MHIIYTNVYIYWRNRTREVWIFKILICLFHRNLRTLIHPPTLNIIHIYHNHAAYYNPWTLRTKTDLHSVSPNMTTLKSGLYSAIFFNHSKHAPHGDSGFKWFESFFRRHTLKTAIATKSDRFKHGYDANAWQIAMRTRHNDTLGPET